MSNTLSRLPPSNVVPMEQPRMQPPPQEEKPAPPMSFSDLLDVVNPLQHIPVVSTIYQKFTGDTIESGPRMLGGALFGAITGSFLPSLATAAFNTIVKETSGRDAGEHVASLFESTPGEEPPVQMVAPTVPTPQGVAMAPVPAGNEYRVFAAPPPAYAAPAAPVPQGEDARDWDGENIQLAIDRYQAGHKAPALRRPAIQVQG